MSNEELLFLVLVIFPYWLWGVGFCTFVTNGVVRAIGVIYFIAGVIWFMDKLQPGIVGIW